MAEGAQAVGSACSWVQGCPHQWAVIVCCPLALTPRGWHNPLQLAGPSMWGSPALLARTFPLGMGQLNLEGEHPPWAVAPKPFPWRRSWHLHTHFQAALVCPALSGSRSRVDPELLEPWAGVFYHVNLDCPSGLSVCPASSLAAAGGDELMARCEGNKGTTVISDGFMHYKAFIRTPASPLCSPAPPQLQDIHQLSVSQPAAFPPTLPPALRGKTLVVVFQSVSFSSPSMSSWM